MSTQVIITLSVELGGDDYSTGEPDTQMVTIASSPAQLFPYELQAAADNYLLISDQIPAQFLWIDPQAASGASFILKGATTDVGVAISSTNPSLVPVSQITPFPGGGGFTTTGYSGAGVTAYFQNQLVLNSSLQTQTQVGWF